MPARGGDAAREHGSVVGRVDGAGVVPAVPQIDRHRDFAQVKGPVAHDEDEVTRIAFGALRKAFTERAPIGRLEGGIGVDGEVDLGTRLRNEPPHEVGVRAGGERRFEPHRISRCRVQHPRHVEVQHPGEDRVVEVVLPETTAAAFAIPAAAQASANGAPWENPTTPNPPRSNAEARCRTSAAQSVSVRPESGSDHRAASSRRDTQVRSPRSSWPHHALWCEFVGSLRAGLGHRAVALGGVEVADDGQPFDGLAEQP